MRISRSSARRRRCLIDPATKARGWGEEHIRREETAGRIAIIRGKPVRSRLGRAETIEEAVYDLKAVNPNAAGPGDTRTPAELLAIIEDEAVILRESLARLQEELIKQP